MILLPFLVLSALPYDEKYKLPVYLQETIYWGETDEDIGDILESLEPGKK